MAKGEMHAALVGLFVTALIVFFASFEVDRRLSDEGPVDERLEVPKEAAAPK